VLTTASTVLALEFLISPLRYGLPHVINRLLWFCYFDLLGKQNLEDHITEAPSLRVLQGFGVSGCAGLLALWQHRKKGYVF